MLTWRHVDALFAIDAGVRALNEGSRGSYDAVCFRNGAEQCVLDSVLELWCTRDHFTREVVRAADPQAALLRVVNSGRLSCGGQDVAPKEVYGGVTHTRSADRKKWTPAGRKA